ncbi:MAG: superoxide dismutase family protein [Gemmatimonadaceae bacterium]|nr:superoxide dismutase family protein [Gemmatimonadaceae bacterium]
MRSLSRISIIAVVSTIALGCAQLQTLAGRQGTATVALSGAGGELRGGGEVWQDNNGQVHVDLQLQGLPAGTHAIHFHAVGSCDSGSAAFSGAGAHYNPANKQHGLSNAAGPHAGDAPNFTVEANGNAHVQFVTDRVTVTAGGATLFDADGSSLVVHVAADDQVSQPSGNSGDRIACGVIRQVLK